MYFTYISGVALFCWIRLHAVDYRLVVCSTMHLKRGDEGTTSRYTTVHNVLISLYNICTSYKSSALARVHGFLAPVAPAVTIRLLSLLVDCAVDQ